MLTKTLLIDWVVTQLILQFVFIRTMSIPIYSIDQESRSMLSSKKHLFLYRLNTKKRKLYRNKQMLLKGIKICLKIYFWTLSSCWALFLFMMHSMIEMSENFLKVSIPVRCIAVSCCHGIHGSPTCYFYCHYLRHKTNDIYLTGYTIPYNGPKKQRLFSFFTNCWQK